MDLKKYIRSIPDWPKKGILFRDITPLLGDVDALTQAIEALCEGLNKDNIDYVAAVEARGFILGASIAERLGAGFIPIRKKGKLPSKTESIKYDLEYSTDTLEVHKDALQTGDRILMFDDLLATGGTMTAACQLIEKIGGSIIGVSFLIELADLKGREKLSDYKVHTVISF
ncbi:MAG: adenine phosphoribosyltransferase [Planctomycetota bacterium]